MKRMLISGIIGLVSIAVIGCGGNKEVIQEATMPVMETGSIVIEGDGNKTVSENNDTKADDSKVQDSGCSSGNINNGGIVNEYEDVIYYFNKSDSNRLYASDKDGNRAVGNILGAIDINACDECIIYLNNGIYRYEFATDTSTLIVSGQCRSVNKYKDRIYFLKNENDINVICSCDLKGEDFRILNDSISGYMNIYNDKIYYLNGTDEGSIHSINLDGSDDKRISSFGNVQELIACEKGLYYVSGSSTDYNIWNIGFNGSGDTKIYGKSAKSLNYYDGELFFLLREDNTLCKTDADGNDCVVLDEGNFSSVNVVRDWVYYFVIDDMDYYRIKKDGSGKEAVR